MAGLIIPNSLSSSSLNLTRHPKPPLPLPAPPTFLSLFNTSCASSLVTTSLPVGDDARRRPTGGRGTSIVTRAGLSSTSYIFAFVFPLSLLVVTILTSIQIGNRLDQKFLEEQAVNQAILEAEEDGGDDDISREEEEPAPPRRTRNRPKREVERSST